QKRRHSHLMLAWCAAVFLPGVLDACLKLVPVQHVSLVDQVCIEVHVLPPETKDLALANARLSIGSRRRVSRLPAEPERTGEASPWGTLAFPSSPPRACATSA